MPFEVINLHLGQCGNQIGRQFWRKLCEEHGIGADGRITKEPIRGDIKETFFYQADSSRYVPRAILLDLEPRVIQTVLNSEEAHLFNRENIFVAKHGGGAGNSWASGYAQGAEIYEKVFEIVDREAEAADRLEGFNLTHAISGGTGSGCGSFVLEKLRERFPKKYIQTFSVFANQTEGSDVVVEPYNSMLTLQRLIEQPDAVFVLDNSALHRIAENNLSVARVDHEHVNSLVTRIMCAATTPVRFANPMYSRLFSLMLPLFAFPPMRFIQSGFAPIVEPGEEKNMTRKTTVNDVLRRLLQPSAMMVSTGAPNSDQAFLAALALLSGEYDESEVTASLQAVRRRGTLKRAPWLFDSALHLVHSEASPYLPAQSRVSGLLLANHTNITGLFESTVQGYQRLRKKSAFLDKYEKESSFELAQFDEAEEVVKTLIALYKEAEKPDFIRHA